MRHLVLCCLLALAGRLVQAQTDSIDRAIGYRRPGMSAARVLAGQVYRTTAVGGAARARTLDAYRPARVRAGDRRPVLLFVHGGLVARAEGPPATEWPIYRAWGRLAAASGLVGVTFNHRLTTDGNLEEAADDVDAAVAHVRSHAAALGADPDRMCVAVFSAGGPLASPFLAGRYPSVRCVVLFYPYLDLEHMRVASPFRPAISASRVDSLEGRFSPARIAREHGASLPPVFVAMAGRDAIPGLNESIRRFMDAALAGRAQVDFALHRDGEHGFDGRNHDARTREILEDVVGFVRRRLTR